MRYIYYVILPLIFVGFGHRGVGQTKHGLNWVINGPSSYKVRFTSGIPEIAPYATGLRFHAGASCISDSFGRLRIVCDGYRLWDSVGNVIEGGDTITPKAICEYYFGFSIYSQSSLILPMGDDIYWVICSTVSDSEFNFHWPTTVDDLFDLLTYTVVDMKANNGMGKVLRKANILEGNGRFSRSQMTACRHADGRSWWLIKHGKDTNRIFKYVLTKDSVYNYYHQDFGPPYAQNADFQGQSSFSNAGKLFATVVLGSNKLFIASFDRCSGIFSNSRVVDLPINFQAPSIPTNDTVATGVCFSPNDSLIYVVKDFNLYQLDIYDTNSISAWSHIANMDTNSIANFSLWNTLYGGPDGKIYIGNWNAGKALSVVNSPNVKGAGCQFCARCLRFPNFGANTAPNMPNYALGKDTTVNCWPMGLSESEESAAAERCLVYPNPAQSQLTIESEAFKKGLNHLRIFNLMGQCVLEEAFRTVSGKHTVSVQGLPSGVYMLKVNNVVRRVVVE